MKNLAMICLSLILLGSAPPLWAQDKVYDRMEVDYNEKRELFLDSEGRPVTGLIIWNKGDYRREIPVTGGRQNGLRRSFLRGRLLMECLFIDGKLSGNYRVYDHQGRLLGERRYAEFLTDSGWERDYDAQGRITWECAMDFFQRPKVCHRYEYYADGRLKSRVPGVFKKEDEKIPALHFNEQGRLTGPEK